MVEIKAHTSVPSDVEDRMVEGSWLDSPEWSVDSLGMSTIVKLKWRLDALKVEVSVFCTTDSAYMPSFLISSPLLLSRLDVLDFELGEQPLDC